MSLLPAACSGRVYKITSHSMEPTLAANSYITAVPVVLSELQRGDIVLYQFPQWEKEFYAKRLIGMPNETIEIRDKAIYIDGELLEEPYPVAPIRSGEVFGPEKLAEDEYFILGDNRPNSSDSRRVGPIPKDQIVGKVVVTWWNRLLNQLEQKKLERLEPQEEATPQAYNMWQKGSKCYAT